MKAARHCARPARESCVAGRASAIGAIGRAKSAARIGADRLGSARALVLLWRRQCCCSCCCCRAVVADVDGGGAGAGELRAQSPDPISANSVHCVCIVLARFASEPPLVGPSGRRRAPSTRRRTSSAQHRTPSRTPSRTPNAERPAQRPTMIHCFPLILIRRGVCCEHKVRPSGQLGPGRPLLSSRRQLNGAQ